MFSKILTIAENLKQQTTCGNEALRRGGSGNPYSRTNCNYANWIKVTLTNVRSRHRIVTFMASRTIKKSRIKFISMHVPQLHHVEFIPRHTPRTSIQHETTPHSCSTSTPTQEMGAHVKGSRRRIQHWHGANTMQAASIESNHLRRSFTTPHRDNSSSDFLVASE